MNKKIILSTLSVATLLIISSCTPSTPQARIAKNPALFESLSNSDKENAQQGKIERGMHKDAVNIALGKPAGVSQGNRNGKTYEKWGYTSISPVYRNNLHPYGYYGYGRRHCSRYGYGFGYSPQVYYVQRTAATIEFDQYDRVTEWVTRK